MQLQVTMTGQRITKVAVLQHTDDGDESARIDAAALPSFARAAESVDAWRTPLSCDLGALTIVGA